MKSQKIPFKPFNLLKPLAGLLLLAAVGFGWPGCTTIENQRPNSDFENSTGNLPLFDIQLDSSGTKTIRFDSIAQGGNFAMTFTPLVSGKIKIVEAGKALNIQMDGRNWRKDSTEYTICKGTTCRNGKILLTNVQYKKPDTTKIPIIIPPVDTSCSKLTIRSLNVNFETAGVIKNLFPSNGKGRIDSLKSQTYDIFNQGDSAIIFNTQGVEVEQKWAWDTISYQLKASDRKCWIGKISIIIGDVCEPGAKDDVFNIPTGKALWNELDLIANDKGCSGLLGTYLTRTSLDFDYGGFKIMETENGILTDTLILGLQHYKYVKTKPLATSDKFTYYFKNLSTNRVTKALVKITF